jgi:ribosomal protein S18 acetylase RimI-like enzyme
VIVEREHINDLIDTAWRARRNGRREDAERGLLDAVDASRRVSARRELIRALKALAHVVRDAGEDDRALPLYVEAVALSREEGDPLALAHTIRHLGDLHGHAGRLQQAGECYAEALSLYKSTASPPALDCANALRPAALLKERQGDRGAARQLWLEARGFYQTAAVQAGVDECNRHLSTREDLQPMVREATPGDELDAGDVERLATADLRRVYRPTAAAFQARTALDGALRRLVAVLDGRVVGTVRYRVEGERLSLLALGVHPSFRLRGVARALVRQLEAIAAEAQCTAITLYTILQTGNVAVFERLGFEIESEAPTPLFEGEHHQTLTEVSMRKRLPPCRDPR